MPIPPALAPSEAPRSEAPSLHRHYPASTVVWASPTPARAAAQGSVEGRDPSPNAGLPRYAPGLPDVLSPLPRWPPWVHASVASPRRGGLPHSSCGSASTRYCRGMLRVHTRYGPPGCSPPKVDLCPRSFEARVAPGHRPGSYRVEPTTTRAGLAPAGLVRPRGAPRNLLPRLAPRQSLAPPNVGKRFLLRFALSE